MYRVLMPFRFFVDGINPADFEEGVQPLPEIVAEVALAEGWAKLADTPPTTAPRKGRGKK